MQLGCSEIDITPQIPINLDGYLARKNPARDIANNLYARGFLFRDGDLRLGLITADLLMLDREQARLVREAAGRHIGIDPAKIIVSCSHTHSGPSPTPTLGNPPDPAYIDWLLKALAGTLLLARENLEEVEMGSASCLIDGVSTNRRNPTERIDRELTLLGFQNNKGVLKALLLNFACHPTVLGADNLSVTPDFPGAAVAAVKNIFPGTVVGFLNGACGDISTRFTRRGQTHGEAKRLGTGLGAAAASLAALLSFAPGQLAATEVTIPLAAKTPMSPKKAAAEIVRWQKQVEALQRAGAPPGELRQAQTGLEGALLQKELSKALIALEKNVTLNIWRLGDLGLAALPGELFSSLGENIKKESPFTHTMIAGYSNGYIGYIPSRKAYEQGGYEVLSSPLAPGFGEYLAAAVVNALNIIWKE